MCVFNDSLGLTGVVWDIVELSCLKTVLAHQLKEDEAVIS